MNTTRLRALSIPSATRASIHFVRFAGVCTALIMLSATSASAQVTISARETGGDVVFTVSGAFDPGTSSNSTNFGPETKLNPSGGEFEIWMTNSTAKSIALDAAVPFGPGAETQDVGIGSGSNIAIFGGDLWLDNAYMAGDPLNGTLTFAGATFTSLGVTARALPYVWTVTETGATIALRFPDIESRKQELARQIQKVRKQIKKARKLGQTPKVKRLAKQLGRLGLEFNSL